MRNLFIFLVLLSSSVFGDPSKLTLMARVSLSDGYQIPVGSLIGVSTPVINNRGDVSFEIESIANPDGTFQAGVWFRRFDQSTGEIVHKAKANNFISNTSINNSGEVVFSEFNETQAMGIYQYTSDTDVLSKVVNPTSNNLFSFPQINDASNILYRGLDSVNDIRSIRLKSASNSVELMREGITDSRGKKVSYVFRPTFNNQNKFVAKVRIGEPGQWDETQPDEIRLYSSDKTYEVIARDIDGASNSLFLKFHNSVGLSNSGMIAFVGTVSGNKQGLFLYKDSKVKAVALEGEGELKTIEYFAPAVNNNGLVAFRGVLKSGRRGIFVGDWNGFNLVIKEGDLVPTDRETGRVYVGDKSAFVGGIGLNDFNQLIFHAGIEAKDASAFLGTAIYVYSL